MIGALKTASTISHALSADPAQQTTHQTPRPFSILNLSDHTPQHNATAETATREAEIINIQDAPHYAKNINYGNQRAAEEVLMAKYMALTGLPTPMTYLGTHCENLFNHSHRRDLGRMTECQREECDLACVVSKIEPTFKDLGRFLLEDGIKKIKEASQILQYETFLANYENAYQQEKDLLPPEKQPESGTLSQKKLRALIQSQPKESELTEEQRQLLKPLRQAKRAQLQALHKMYHLLPDALHKEMELALYASEFIGNNDFLNFSLYNTGFVMRDGVLRAMVIDYGNSGPSGFKGQYIEDSLDVAKQRARIQDPIAANIWIQKTDLQFSAMNNRSRSQSTNDLPHDGLLKPGHQHEQDTLRSHSADYLPLPKTSITGLGGIPRNSPFIGLFRSNIKAETTWIMDEIERSSSNVPEELDSAIEIAYRLLQIPEPILLEVAQAHWPVGNDDRFPFFDPYHGSNLNAKDIANVMQERRNAYIYKFTPDQIKHWEKRHPERALLAQHEVTEATHAFRNVASQAQVVQPAA